MKSLTFISGSAGKGKTYRLMECLNDWVNKNPLNESQKVLVITRMHGSRKRLIQRLNEKCPVAKYTVNTVDGFALSILNRWRKSLELEKPVFPLKDQENEFKCDIIGNRASFELIMRSTARLMESPIVCKFVSYSFPLIVIDEFQDCTGTQLLLIKKLRKYVDMIVAADPFQALDGNEEAVNWLYNLKKSDKATEIDLEKNENKRTDNIKILEAANYIFKNQRVQKKTIDYWVSPNYNLAIWKVLRKDTNEIGTHALLVPAANVIYRIVNSYEKQKAKRKRDGKGIPPFFWKVTPNETEIKEKYTEEFNEYLKSKSLQNRNSSRNEYFYQQLLKLSKNRSFPINGSSHNIILDYIVSNYIHKIRAYSTNQINNEVLTIHSAKNNEFDYVYIFWDFNIMKNRESDYKRRLLYNAITRAKKECKLIVIGKKGDLNNCSVLSLLGEAEDMTKKVHKNEKTKNFVKTGSNKIPKKQIVRT